MWIKPRDSGAFWPHRKPEQDHVNTPLFDCIYLDHNATTPMVPAALDRFTAVARDTWGNASSVHHFGQQAKAVLDEARAAVAALIGAAASEVVFTAGGTEGDNAAVRGARSSSAASSPPIVRPPQTVRPK